jgi:hypothetical protein
MRKKITYVVLALVLISAGLLAGCAPVASPALGLIYTDVQWPQGETSNSGTAKVGKGICTSILGLVAMGDCSVQSAAKNARITRIHHVDYHSTSILFVYGTLEVSVYGD